MCSAKSDLICPDGHWEGMLLQNVPASSHALIGFSEAIANTHIPPDEFTDSPNAHKSSRKHSYTNTIAHKCVSMRIKPRAVSLRHTHSYYCNLSYGETQTKATLINSNMFCLKHLNNRIFSVMTVKRTHAYTPRLTSESNPSGAADNTKHLLAAVKLGSQLIRCSLRQVDQAALYHVIMRDFLKAEPI